MSFEFKRNIKEVCTMVMVSGLIYLLLSSILIIELVIQCLPYFGIDTGNIGIIWGKLNIITMSINASINPVLYIILNRRYRVAFIESVTKVCCCRKKDSQPLY